MRKYVPKQLVSQIDTEKLARYLASELLEISRTINNNIDQPFEQVNKPPDKAAEGMVRYADGVQWNPTGAGEGFYVYERSAWRKLTMAP